MDPNDLSYINSQNSQDTLQETSDNNIVSSSTDVAVISKNKKTSAVTPYFINKPGDNTTAICVICKNTYSKNTATDKIIDTIKLYIANTSSSSFLKNAATQILEKIEQYIVHIYDEAIFINLQI
ncbi:14691_t:CDS:2 [Dentiscutata heterogama]|uniref:14691_t:CDS:1 n=1 Tax=Dentiscutata heterogama TaxID=1316150 RepID=A0ACA9JZN1_9GLOM|nr:14691_t:CDS:2 [Dentiscutata heterogama]